MNATAMKILKIEFTEDLCFSSSFFAKFFLFYCMVIAQYVN